MSEVRAEDGEEVQTKGKASSSSARLVVIVGGVIVLAGAGLLLFTVANSEPGCAGQGPCMLYFYTDD